MEKNPQIVEILESFWPKNKAKGQLAQAVLMQEVQREYFGEDACERFSGLLADRTETSGFL